MTVKRNAGNVVFVCDIAKSARCEDELDTETDDFDEARRLLRAEGWGTHRTDGGGWMHQCPRCPIPR